jgi:hypothetical protein
VPLFPRIFTKNWQLKLLALAVAVLLWTVPRFEAQETQTLEDIPIEVNLTDQDWALVGQSDSMGSVTVSGPTRDLIALGLDRPPVLIPVVEVDTTDTMVYLSEAWFRAPDRVVVENLRPQAVMLTFERIEDRYVALSAPLFGDLPDSISLAGPPEIIPATALVIGTLSRLEGLDSLRLVPINLATVTGPDTIVQPVDTAAYGGLQPLTEEAAVVLPIETTEELEFPDLPLIPPTMASDPQLQVRPAVVTVVVSGAGSILESLDPTTLRVGIPATAATLSPGEEERVLPFVDGIPPLLRYRVVPESVLLRRPVGQ